MENTYPPAYDIKWMPYSLMVGLYPQYRYDIKMIEVSFAACLESGKENTKTLDSTSHSTIFHENLNSQLCSVLLPRVFALYWDLLPFV